jgi:hypothetical protein
VIQAFKFKGRAGGAAAATHSDLSRKKSCLCRPPDSDPEPQQPGTPSIILPRESAVGPGPSTDRGRHVSRARAGAVGRPGNLSR